MCACCTWLSAGQPRGFILSRKQELKDAIEAYARACERVIYVRLGKSGEAVQERTARKEALEKLLDEVVPDDN